MFMHEHFYHFFSVLSAESKRRGLHSKRYHNFNSTLHRDEKTNRREYYDEKANAKTDDQTIISDDEEAVSDHEETHQTHPKTIVREANASHQSNYHEARQTKHSTERHDKETSDNDETPETYQENYDYTSTQH